MKVIDPDKALAVPLGIAGLYWATNKKLPEPLVMVSLLVSITILARDVSQLFVEVDQLENNNQNLAGCACQECANKNLQFNPFNIHF